MPSSPIPRSSGSTSAPGSDAKTILRVEDLVSGYGSTKVLWGVSLEVQHGEVVALVGRNGMGKTTLVRTLIGLIEAQRGRTFYNGRNIGGLGPAARARLGIGYVPQGREIFANLTVEENLRMGDRVAHERKGRKLLFDLVYEMFPIVKERARQKAGTLSGGQQQMVAIGRALIGNPDLLLVDEPTEGLQPSIILQIEQHFLNLKRNRDLAILLVEQNTQLIKRVADRCYVLEHGSIKQMLAYEELQHSTRLEECLAL